MLDDKQCIALIGHPVEKLHQTADIVEMQPVSRLIQNEYLSPLIQLARQLHTLQLAAGKRRHRLIQVQVTESDLYQRIEFPHKILSFKELDRLTDGHIHDFRNIFSLVLIVQHFLRIPRSVADFANRLNRIHICHIRYNYTFSLARRAGALGIETEICLCDMVRFRKKRPDRIRDIQIRRRGRTQIDTDILLPDRDHLAWILARKIFHQGAFSRTSHTSDDRHHAKRQFYAQIF